MDRQRKLILFVSILVVIALGLGIYFGMINNPQKKTLVITQKNEEPKHVVDYGYNTKEDNNSIVINNTENNFILTLPDDWRVSNSSYGSQMVFYSGDVETRENSQELIKGIKIDININPVDQNLNILENISIFSELPENYEEVKVNGLPAIVVENFELGYSKTTYIYDDIEGLMYVLTGYDGGGDGSGDFAIQYEEIVNSFKLTNR